MIDRFARQQRPFNQNPGFYGETIKDKRPRGHYTARLLKRLPIARFHRCSINRRTRKRLHRNETILERGGAVAGGVAGIRPLN